MPVEIRELIIRATVSPAETREERREPPRDPAPPRHLSPAELERVVTLCVKRVLRSMKRQHER